MILHLIRHGETPHNRDAVGLGRADIELSAEGSRQASALGKRFEAEQLDLVYSSPLQRCASVARAVAEPRGLPVMLREELLELDVGETEGMTFPEMRARFGDFFQAWAGDNGSTVRMPGGESLADLAERLQPLIDDVLAAPAEHVAVVSHNFVIRVLLCRLLGLDLSSFRAFNVDLASVTTLRTRDRRVTVRRLNDRCHLEHLEPASASA